MSITYSALVEKHIEKHIIGSLVLGEKILRAIKFTSGSVSEVYLLETSRAKYVFKAISRGVFRDVIAFEKRGEDGVILPKIIQVFESDELQYYIMEHVDLKTVDNTFLKNVKLFHVRIGETLGKMHQRKTDGYWDFENGIEPIRGTTESVKKMYDGKYPLADILRTGKEIGFEEKDIIHARDEVITYGNGRKTSFCHNDFYMHNIFDEQKMIVIDPNTDLDIGELDLCRTIYYIIMGDYSEFFLDTIEGYRNFSDTDISNDLIQKGVLLRGIKVLLNEEFLDRLKLFKERFSVFQEIMLAS